MDLQQQNHDGDEVRHVAGQPEDVHLGEPRRPRRPAMGALSLCSSALSSGTSQLQLPSAHQGLQGLKPDPASLHIRPC